MKKLLCLLCLFAAMRSPAAQLIRDGKLQTDLNANTNRITNATDVVTASGVSLTNLAANLGGGSGTLYRVESQVSGLGFTTPNGPTAFLTGTVATAGSFADTNSVGVIATNAVNQSTNVSARLASNVWASADSTTNYYQSISLGGGYNWSIQITNKGGAYYLNDTNRSLSRYEGGVITGPMTNIFSITSGRLGGGNAWNGLLRMWWDAEPAYVELSPNAGGTYPLGLSLDGGAQHPIWSSYYQGSGTGMDSDLLDGLNSSAFFQSIATNGSGNVITNLTFGGSVITQQMGTVTGGGGGSGVATNLIGIGAASTNLWVITTSNAVLTVGTNLYKITFRP